MNSTNYITPFWIQDLNQTSGTFTINIYRTTGNVGAYNLTLYYSLDATTWDLFGTTSSATTISQTFAAGSKVYLKCTSNYWSLFIRDGSIAHQITANKYHSVGGNVMSLIYGDNFTNISPVTNEPNYKTFPDDSIKGVFLRMFFNNTNLIDASELVLPVTHSTSTLPSQQNNTVCLASCYSRMFYGCTNLVNGPHIDLRARGQYDLPYCFQSMFQGCTSLMSVHCNTQAGNFRFNSMFSSSAGANGSVFYDYSGGPASSEVPTARMEYRRIVSMYLSGVHEYDRVVDWHSDYSGRVHQVTDNNSKVIYLNEDAQPKYSVPFYVENTTNSTQTLYIRKSQNEAPTLTIEYSTNNSDWSTLGTTSITPLTKPIQAHNKIYLRCNTNVWGRGMNTYNCMYGVSKVGGNIMSLLYGSKFNGEETTFPGNTQNQFSKLFYDLRGSSVLTDASELLLPAKELRYSCYEAMFYNCVSLVNTPALPATSLVYGCYSDMFVGCTSLTKAPDLNAYVLAQGCYSSMFQNCTSLNEIKCLALNNSATQCTYYWLDNVSSTGTFYKKAGTTWTTGASGIPSGWTVVEV